MSHRTSPMYSSHVPAAVTLAGVVTAVLMMAACQVDEPTSARVDAHLITANAAGNVDNTTRARFTMDDSINVGTASAPVWVPAAVRGDGRLRDGSLAAPGGLSNEYQGNFCSVNAVIGSGMKGEGYQFFLDMSRFASSTLPASCLPTRYHRYYVNGPGQAPANASTLASIPNVSSMSVGQTMIQSFHSGTMAELGYALWWDDAYPPASSILVTRLPNVIDEYGRSVRQWRVGSRGSHKAAFVLPATSKNSGPTITSTFPSMPWAMTITEVPYPFPTFP
jgi:hypothetical protein